MTPAPQISIVIPLYNEEDSIPELYRQLTAVLEDYGQPYEVIVVDDGSEDGSFARLQEIYARDKRWRIVRLRRNFGQTAGFAAGFDLARGEVIITLDADLQNDPADIPLLMKKMAEGYDIVSGWRVQRKDTFLSRRLPSMIANWLISRTTGVYLHDYGCSLKAYRREVVKNLRLYGELHRFVPAVASWMGVTIAEVPVNHRAREHGQSKYGISRTFRVMLDLLTVYFLLSYSTRPIQVFGSIGLASSGLGMLLGAYLSYVKLILGQNIGSRPLLLLAVLLIMVGVQMIAMGLLGELIVRTYYESQNKPIYFVRELLQAEGGEESSVIDKQLA
ncbi:MAG: glycosyltransferase family 2 protein [Chloroflexi bacterium]|nr:glycosyltransferase family 2 protein [Chloroflexota bacterium]